MSAVDVGYEGPLEHAYPLFHKRLLFEHVVSTTGTGSCLMTGINDAMTQVYTGRFVDSLSTVLLGTTVHIQIKFAS